MSKGHVPVMVREVLRLVQSVGAKEPRVLDMTLGAGGHTDAVLREFGAASVLGVDRDPAQGATVARLGQEWGPKRFAGLCPRKWSQLGAEVTTGSFDAVVADLGLCTTQLEERSRGFSFRGSEEDALDMRMSSEGRTASELLNGMTEEALVKMFAELGQEPLQRARSIAEQIVKQRPIQSAGHLAKLLRSHKVSLVPKHLDPATLGFQALRMTVNEEVDELIAGLGVAARALRPDGILIVIAYHSIEDRIVKKFIQLSSPQKDKEGAAAFQKSTEFVRPSEAEAQSNPRSASATLRYAIRSPHATFTDVAATLAGLALKRRV
jgi:16S rRNA (cytosine1402-N4)-methyltransferase